MHNQRTAQTPRPLKVWRDLIRPKFKFTALVTMRTVLPLLSIVGFSFAAVPSQSGAIQLRDTVVAPSQFQTKVAKPDWVLPPKPGVAAKTGAVSFALADSQMQVTRLPEYFVNRILQINDISGLNQFGNVQIEFVPEYQKVLLHHIAVIRNGQRLDRLDSANIRFLQRERGLEQGIYSGEVTASILLKDVQVGDQVDYAYTIIGENPIFEGLYSNLTAWQIEAPNAFRRVAILFDDQRDLKYRWLGDDIPAEQLLKPRVEISNGKTRWTFEAKDLPAYAFENHYPPGYLPVRMLQVSEHGDWNNVGRWANRLFSQAQPTAKIKQVADRFRGLASDDAKVQAALSFVQGQIRYFSVSLGESSHRPADPAEVLDRRYGDCKDKTQLLIAILRELGIKAQAALVSTVYQRALDRWEPSPLSFDHVIVRVEVAGNSYFVDPTRLPQVGRLERMGQGLTGYQAFVVSEQGGRFEEIRSLVGSELPMVEVAEQIEFSHFDQPATLATTQLLRGNAADSLRIALARSDTQAIKQWLDSAVTYRYSAAKLQGEYAVRDNHELNEITITAVYSVPEMAVQDRKSWSVKVAAPNIRGFITLPQSRQRAAPFGAIVFPYNMTYALQILFPETVAASYDPHSTRSKNQYWDFSSQRTFRGSRATVRMQVKTLTDSVPAKEFPRFVDDLEKAVANLPRFVYVDSTIINTNQTADRQRNLEQMLIRRYSEEVQLLTKAIESGTLNPDDVRQALRDRAGAYVSMQRWAEATKDAEQLLKKSAIDISALQTRANILAANRKFTDALADYNRAVRLGAGPEAFYRRGIVHHFQNNHAAAADDFNRASIGREGTEVMYSRLWHVYALRRLNQPVPAEIHDLLRTQPADQWPHAALKMAATGGDPEVMLRSLNKLTGQELEFALAEAYFFAGQEYLVRGNKDKAKEMFERCVAIGAIHYIEHISAALELAAMK